MKVIKLTEVFNWDGKGDCENINLTVPEEETDASVGYSLRNMHQHLLFGNPIVYSIKGKTIETLLNYICERRAGWSWARE